MRIQVISDIHAEFLARKSAEFDAYLTQVLDGQAEVAVLA
ncbi:hypothetical protein KIPB_011273, partial [Kipferlia bialata]|eukprot:g11273.t1